MNTKYDIGKTVWFIEEETQYGGRCSCGDGRLPDKKINKIHKSKVTEIFINCYLESYNLSYPRCLPVERLYATKEEAKKDLINE